LVHGVNHHIRACSALVSTIQALESYRSLFVETSSCASIGFTDKACEFQQGGFVVGAAVSGKACVGCVGNIQCTTVHTGQPQVDVVCTLCISI